MSKPKWVVGDGHVKVTKLPFRNHLPFIGVLLVVWICLWISWMITSPTISVADIKPVKLDVNDVFDVSNVDDWKSVSGDEVSSFVVTLKSESVIPTTVSHGMLIIDKFEDPIGNRTVAMQGAYRWIENQDEYTFVVINELKKGNAALFPIDATIQPGLEHEMKLWIRLLQPDRPRVAFIQARIRFFDGPNRFVDSKPFKLSIHRGTEKLFTNEKPSGL